MLGGELLKDLLGCVSEHLDALTFEEGALGSGCRDGNSSESGCGSEGIIDWFARTGE